jgi:hypothetical protein
MPARVAVIIADPVLSRDIVSNLRWQGYLVVEPEIAHLTITQGRGYVRVDIGGGPSMLLPDPVSVFQVIAAARRFIPPLVR